MSITEIESAIGQLSPNEFAELMAWIDSYRDKQWDKQIENDLESGRFDKLLAEVDKEYGEGLARPL
jgi:hypothetical protein